MSHRNKAFARNGVGTVLFFYAKGIVGCVRSGGSVSKAED